MNICLGTDSLASTFTLSMFDEMRILFGKTVEASVASSEKIIDAINRVYEREAGGGELENDEARVDEHAAAGRKIEKLQGQIAGIHLTLAEHDQSDYAGLGTLSTELGVNWVSGTAIRSPASSPTCPSPRTGSA